MKGPNWIRLMLCGFVSGVVWNVLSAASVSFLASDFVASLQHRAPRPGLGGAFFYAIDLAMGIWAVWLYTAIAPRYGARPATAAIVGVAWWFLKTLQSAKWAALGFVDLSPALLPLGVATLIATILASMAGAWLYQVAIEPSATDLSET